ncbi:hypothetical protein HYPBUDRAFT_145090 [Hyphopichia burtonii NRRL Y-1933]|uniref:Zn(2)-C6 fungal-type domain-containing protein n=1 Tax=Hyphopichia burtonii NRRL Y-1933 TaxID=984485 RepID=A0A1E4RCH1_9ASCO|nr:hypothetical protein HYPBUDRAFT_145090 [Hyphopichia burtonii NRRL Y-1933]ODV64957.1 hypothetical protein HYPBUDRAFT_145090 [Hyphopichia burtonii NRRL Y-1933]
MSNIMNLPFEQDRSQDNKQGPPQNEYQQTQNVQYQPLYRQPVYHQQPPYYPPQVPPQVPQILQQQIPQQQIPQQQIPQQQIPQQQIPQQQIPQQQISQQQIPQRPFGQEFQQPYPLVNERRSRRSHKNSRDGCPNCKKRRVKCTEELPSCANCTKKKYRCGYLDFPADKLEAIRKKNEIKDRESVPESNLSGSSTPSVKTLSSNATPNIRTGQVDEGFNNDSLEQKQESIPSNNKSLQLQQPILENFQTNQPFINIEDLRKYVYTNSFIKVAQDMNWNSLLENSDFNSLQIPRFKPSNGNNDNFNDFFNNSSNHHQPLFGDQLNRYDSMHLDDYQSQMNSLMIDNPKEEHQHEQHEQHPHQQQLQQLQQYQHFDETLESYLHPKTNTSTTIPHGPLPNAIIKPINFPKIEVDPKLKNVFLQRYLDLNNHDSSIVGLINEEYEHSFQPVWNNKLSHNFWTTVFNQSVVLNVYFSFFMDRSLNFLLKVCSVVVHGDSFITNLDDPSDSGGYSSNSSKASTPKSPEAIMKKVTETSKFSKHDLNVLTKKSFSYYGKLISDLRASLSTFHIEFSTKISLFSAWSSFIHSHSTVDTISLLYNGTALLFSKILNEANLINDVTPTIQVLMEIFHTHCLVSKVPDYTFDVIYEIHDYFIQFKTLCESLMDSKFKLEDCLKRKTKVNKQLSIKQFLNDKLFHHDLNELEKFLDKFIKEYYPNIIKINEQYSKKYGYIDRNIHYVSFSLVFELLNHWFRIFPSEVISIGSKMNPFKKTFFLFYSALGRSLNHIIPPIRSLMLVDPCHVFCPKLDFDFGLYQIKKFNDLVIDENQTNLKKFNQFNLLNEMSMNLLRMVHFFDNRLLFYSYYLSTSSALEEPYLKNVEPIDITYRDVLQIIPPKLDCKEKFIEKFNDDFIHLASYPQFERFFSNKDLVHQFNTELYRQENSFQENLSFNYQAGCLNKDFNTQAILRDIHQIEKQRWEESKPDIDRTRLRMHYFELGRREILKCLQYRRR